MSINLYDWQAEAVEAVRRHIRSGKTNVMLASATGSGKTVMGAYLIAECHRKGKRAVFVCDRIPLIQQTSDRFLEFGIPHGVIQAKHERTDPDANIQVASAQTLVRRGWPDDLSLIVVDEAHSLYTNTLRRISKRNCITVGLSATPFSRGLGKYYDAVVNVRTLDQLTADGYLAPFDVYAPSAPDMTGVKVGWDGEWNEKETSQRAMQVVGDCVAEYAEKGGGKKAICFGVDVSHCEELQRQFLNAGIHAALYTYQTGDAQRAMMMEEFRKPDSFIRVMISVSALAKGLDVPDIACLDEKTEVLTPGGWRGMWDEFREVVALDPQRGCLSIEPVEARIMKPYTGDMLEIDGGQCNLRVTGDHKMLIGTKSQCNPHAFVEARTLTSTGRFSIPVSGVGLEATGVPLSDDELRFIAWFITDGGWLKKYNSVHVSQAKPDMVTRIRELLHRLGYKFTEYVFPNQRGYAATKEGLMLHRFGIACGVRRGFGGWEKLRPYLDKGLAPELLQMTDRQFRVFWDELLLGDGNGEKRENRRPQLCLGHQALLANLQALIVMRGHATNATTSVTLKNGDPFWLLSWDDKTHREVKTKYGYVHTSNVSNEKVWCVQNSKGTLIVRRNGRVSVVGNCVIMARPLRKSLIEHIQILGRGLRVDPADPSKRAVILDHSNNVERFYPQTLAFFSEGVTELDDGKPKPAAKTPADKPPPEPYKCPKCSHLHKPMKACPKCGHEYPRKQTGVQHVAGKLSAFTGRPEGTREDRQSFYSQLVAICQAKGWDPGSAKHRYRDRFGEWPDGLSSEPAPPTAKTYAWVQGAVIRYHKSKKVKR